MEKCFGFLFWWGDKQRIVECDGKVFLLHAMQCLSLLDNEKLCFPGVELKGIFNDFVTLIFSLFLLD